MNLKYLFNLILIVSALVLFSCNSAHKKVRVSSIQQDSIIVSDEFSDIKVNYPLTNYSLLDDSIQNKLNSLVHEFEKLSNSIPDTFYRPYQMIVDYEYKSAYKKYLSVSFSIYQFTGGAHGNTFYQTYLYDTSKGQLLSLNDILPKGTFAELRSQVKAKLKAKLSYQDFIDDGTESIESFERFLVTDSSVIFLFQPYDVAPYSEGSQQVEIFNEEFSFLLHE
ncbi:DUF3298 and DUF4163 domain-containing protein [Labilibacter sediminis]|nr:DUF3298 and DUF4163 domain-containing protein [Labilibacter sediminis]